MGLEVGMGLANMPRCVGVRQPQVLAIGNALNSRHRIGKQRSIVYQNRLITRSKANEEEQGIGGSEKLEPVTRPAGWSENGTNPLAKIMPVMALGALFPAVSAGGGLLDSGFDISGPGSVLEALGVLAAVVGIHELGHFSAAKIQNIHVKKFAIGFGPVLWKYKGREVEYSLRAIPLGGFVAFPDEDEDSPYERDDPNLLTNRPVLDRILVTCAGVAANVVFAFTICVVQAGVVGITEPEFSPGIILGDINPNTVAERAGLQKGDIVLQAGDLDMAPEPGSVGKFVKKVRVNPKKELKLKVRRQDSLLDIPITPAEMPDGTGRLGITLAPNVKLNTTKATSVVEAVTLGAREVASLGSNVCRGLWQFVTNFQETSKNVSGPVAILAVGSEVARTDINGLYQFAALINLNLAIVNILPLPALDGGYLVFQILEAIRGEKVDQDFERAVMAGGFLLLTSLGMYLIIKDALNLAKF
ncbi:hypothetical protein M9434_005808 [Picochlorum sp. BPE23]|nr:hypothetical protein M9434_005808 [Picochlorum sp. BPE23]KAI8103560.1 hypothetical protein M9435_004895 [Picochlorum sp. BPE23]